MNFWDRMVNRSNVNIKTTVGEFDILILFVKLSAILQLICEFRKCFSSDFNHVRDSDA